MKKFICLLLLLSAIGCGNQSQGTKFAGDDPFFLGLNDVSLACSSAEPQQLIHTELAGAVNTLLAKYYDGDKFSYQALRNNQNDYESLCRLERSLQTIDPTPLSREDQGAFWLNSYQVMVVTMVTSYYEQVQRPGTSDDLPQNRSIQYILDKGAQRIFSEIKSRFSEGEFSLDDIEKNKIIPLLGTTGQLALYRGAEEFKIPYTTAFTGANVIDRLDELAYEHVNFVTFYDDFPGEFQIFATELFDIFNSVYGYQDPAGRFSDIRSFFAFFLDEDEVGVIKKEDLFKTESIDGETKFIWPFEFSFINWALNERRL